MNRLSASKISAALFVIVIFAIAIRLSCFNGFGAVDDAEYAQFAHAISEGHFPIQDYEGPAVFPLRLGIILPTALLYKFFEVSQWTTVGFSFAISILGILLAFWGTRHFFGDLAGLVAAAIWAILPIDSFHASIFVPDPPAAFFSGGAVILLLYLFQNTKFRTTTRYVGGYTAGFLFGYSWLCKTSLIYLFPFTFILFVYSLQWDWRRNLPVWALAVAGLGSVLAAEMTFYSVVAGDPLFRLHSVQANISTNPAAFDLSAVGNLKAIFKRVVFTGPLTIFFTAQYLFLPLIALFGFLHAIYWKEWRLVVPSLWLILLAAVYNFGSISLKQYIPLLLFERYLYPLFLPATILTSGFIVKLISPRLSADNNSDKLVYKERAFWAVLILGVLLTSAVHRNYQNWKWYPDWTTAVSVVSKKVLPTDPLYTDIVSIHGLSFFWGYPETVTAIKFGDVDSLPDIKNGSYVLINKPHLAWLERKTGWWPNLDGGEHLLPFDESVLRDWRLVWQGYDASLYRVE